MADTGWVSPGTVAQVQGAADFEWEDIENIKNVETDKAVSVVELEDISDSVIQLINSSSDYFGDNKASADTWPAPNEWGWGTWGEAIYGGSEDTWGESLNTSEVSSSNFGIVLQAKVFYIRNYYTYFLEASNFSFNIPSGAQIEGLEVRVVRKEGERDLGGIKHATADVRSIEMRVFYGTPVVGEKYPLPAFRKL